MSLKAKNILAENQRAMSGFLTAQKSWSGKKALCWKCQKEKPRKGGFMRIMPGLQKFVCADCLEAKKGAA